MKMKNSTRRALIRKLALAGLSVCAAQVASAADVTIATFNSPAMLELKRLSASFEKAHPDIKLNWVILEENVLRQRATTDITTNSGQFDVVAIGTYETPQWGKRGWLVPMTNLPVDYDLDDVVKTARDGLSYDGQLYALPFYVESSITFYRKDLFQAAGLNMPDQPTYDQIKQFADTLTDKSKGQYGICLRGKAGWGENMAYVSTVVNTYGGRWFDENWKAQIDTPEWHKAISFYADLLKNDGPPGASSNGFNENLTLMSSGKCAMWIDATAAAGTLYNKSQSKVADKIGFAAAPVAVTPKGSHWLWSWSLRDPPDLEVAGCREEICYMGNFETVHRDGWNGRGLGIRSSGQEVDFCTSRVQAGRSVRRICVESDRIGRPERPVAQEGAVQRDSIRRHPRVPVFRDRGGASYCGRRCWANQCGRSAEGGQRCRRSCCEAGGLSEVSPRNCPSQETRSTASGQGVLPNASRGVTMSQLNPPITDHNLEESAAERDKRCAKSVRWLIRHRPDCSSCEWPFHSR